MKRPAKVFISYAHQDEEHRADLIKSLKTLQREGFISVWHDQEIKAGDEWRGAIHRNLEDADVILLLVSMDFLGSDYIWDVEMHRAIERHEAGSARVVPIIARPCDWQHARISKLQAVPRIPIAEHRSRDAAWTAVAKAIREIVNAPAEETAQKRPSSVSGGGPVLIQRPDSASDLPRMTSELTQAVELFNEHRYLEASALFEEAAMRGDPVAMNNLAYLHLVGRAGVPRDHLKAKEYYMKGASSGSSRVSSNLGFVCRRCHCAEPAGDAKATLYYRQAAEAGDALGMYNLAYMYWWGLGGLEKDAATAVKWLRKSDKLGCPLATRALVSTVPKSTPGRVLWAMRDVGLAFVRGNNYYVSGSLRDFSERWGTSPHKAELNDDCGGNDPEATRDWF